MEKVLTMKIDIPASAMGSYFEIPFTVPEGVERIDIAYSYTRYAFTSVGEPLAGTSKREVNIIDLGLRSPDSFIGASGSGRTHIWVAGRGSSQGYANTEPRAGDWAILVGAYKVESDGAEVTYDITFTYKTLRLFKGDTHTHTLSSDGSLTVPQLTERARVQGLQFLILTDHNNYAQNSEITAAEAITLIPGCEWTHYQGHCNLYGVRRPLQNPLGVNSPEEMELLLREARANGALISINHPFCRYCGWKWGLTPELYDMLEIWNGALHPEDNKACRDWWAEQLDKGEKLPVIGGSDFHRPDLLREVGQPVTGVWALSSSPGDILSAMARGRSYVSFTPDGPGVALRAGSGFMGDTVNEAKTVQAEFTDLKAGDSVHLVTSLGREIMTCENDMKYCRVERAVAGAGYFRTEVYRQPYSQILGPALISNPIYFA